MKVFGNKIVVDEKIIVGSTFIDGSGVGDLGDDVLKERMILAQDGILNISAVMEKNSRTIKGKPVITAKGFMYEKESDDIMRTIKIMLAEDFEKYIKSSANIYDLQNVIRKRLRTYLYQETKRNPVILPVIIEV